MYNTLGDLNDIFIIKNIEQCNGSIFQVKGLFQRQRQMEICAVLAADKSP